MANKRYDQFTAGTPTGTDLILFGDPTTGELKKSPISNIAGGGGNLLLSDYNSANNSGTNPEVMATLTIPANTMANDGDVCKVFGNCNYLTGAGTKQYAVYFGAQQLISRSNASAAQHTAYITMMRESASSMILTAYELQGTGIFTTVGPTTFAWDATINNDLEFRILNGAANDIKYWMMFAEFLLQ
jgi:hypothetical protein